MGFPKIYLEDVAVHYVQLRSNKILRFAWFIHNVNRLLKGNNYYCSFHVYNKFNLITRLYCLKYPMILDIRTGSLNRNKLIRFWKNLEITFTSFFYSHVSVISVNLARNLNISSKKFNILPLGGELQNTQSKTFNELKLLYIGTLDQRNIHETIYGLFLFTRENPDINLHYDIIGTGRPDSREAIQKAIEETLLNRIVALHSRKSRDELIDFFNNCNIGVVYVPKTEYYDFQPTTKLYEYTLAGMPVIVTDTNENLMAINDNTGVICKSTPESFSKAIQKIYENRDKWNSCTIKEYYKHSAWDFIVKNYFEILFN